MEVGRTTSPSFHVAGFSSSVNRKQQKKVRDMKNGFLRENVLPAKIISVSIAIMLSNIFDFEFQRPLFYFECEILIL